ncbi:MAG: response regulator transcription factor [Epsilonproteobacteria bacterium]|nr:response regulator transcription factor [Campylobacterota bacterium]
MIKILIFELDEYWLGHLRTLPYELTFVRSEDEVYEQTYNGNFDFYLFDFDVGFNALQSLRDYKDETISIFISYDESFKAQKKAYTICDDFFKKSVTYIEEIRIKIDYYIAKYMQVQEVIKYNDIYFHTQLHHLYKNGKKITLTNLENELLIMFFKNRGKYIPKDVIYDRFNITDGTLRVKLSNLRKLGFDIQNKRDLGYILQ